MSSGADAGGLDMVRACNRPRRHGYDANIGALYSVTVTSTGKQVFAPQSLSVGQAAFGSTGTDPCSNPCNLTVTNSLGSSATVPLVLKY